MGRPHIADGLFFRASSGSSLVQIVRSRRASRLLAGRKVVSRLGHRHGVDSAFVRLNRPWSSSRRGRWWPMTIAMGYAGLTVFVGIGTLAACGSGNKDGNHEERVPRDSLEGDSLGGRAGLPGGGLSGGKRVDDVVVLAPPAVGSSLGDAVAALDVVECSELAGRYRDCVLQHVPVASRAPMMSAFEKALSSWRSVAGSAAGRSAVADACVAARVQASAATKEFGCAW